VIGVVIVLLVFIIIIIIIMIRDEQITVTTSLERLYFVLLQRVFVVSHFGTGFLSLFWHQKL